MESKKERKINIASNQRSARERMKLRSYENREVCLIGTINHHRMIEWLIMVVNEILFEYSSHISSLDVLTMLDHYLQLLIDREDNT